ncbi:hypothetical protein [Planctobacterium marinum]|uniref:hypothetical protein n=1 Tax=Planctobacterium marinum TaxID=1631968 RepID=UPI001E45C86E|nr:hypothetical protein [Planctobacterium marinum]MCC2606251.1 hypothetical protein [Planctobacterium marinum]
MKKILLYGTGASAKYFYDNYLHSYQILQVVDKNKQCADFWSSPCIKPEQITDYEFDYIVVGSWAILEISKELKELGVAPERILWFQHNKNKLVNHTEFCNMPLHFEMSPESVLYAFYDLNVARTTYDILGFLCLAEIARINAGLTKVHVVIVNATNNDFNMAGKGIISTEEHDWRKRQLLMQSCALLPSCSGVAVTSSRAEAQAILNQARYVFPENYNVEVPVACWEFTHLFEAWHAGHDCLHLRASSPALNYVKNWFNHLGVKWPEKQVVTITLRESEIKPKRNSNVPAWRAFSKYLSEKGYTPVLVPDTDNSWVSFPEAFHFNLACFNVELRMALYEMSFLNTGVNNGPTHLCALNPVCNYIMFKQVVEDYAHSSSQSFIDRGFTIGGSFPDARKGQLFIWEDDEYEILVEAFENLVRGENG